MQKAHPGCNISSAQADDPIISQMDQLTAESSNIKHSFSVVTQIEPRLVAVMQTKSDAYEHTLSDFAKLREGASTERKAMTGHLAGDQDCLAKMDNDENIQVFGIETPFHNPFP